MANPVRFDSAPSSGKIAFEQLVDWATTPAQSGLKLYRWSALISYDLDALNQGWKVLENTPTPPGETDELKGKIQLPEQSFVQLFSTLGRSMLYFDPSAHADNVTLRRRTEELKLLKFDKSPNSTASALSRVDSHRSASRYLSITAQNPKFSYTAQNKVNFEWNEADYDASYEDAYTSTLLRQLCRAYYENDANKRNLVIGGFRPEHQGVIKPLSFRTRYYKDSSQVIAYITLENNEGAIPVEHPQIQVTLLTASAVVDRRASSAIPGDLNQLPQLLLPHATFNMKAANTAAPKDYVAAYNTNATNSQKSSAPAYDANPISALITAGRHVTLSVSPAPPAVTWTLQEGHKGRLILEDGEWHYYAPTDFDPAEIAIVDTATTILDGQVHHSVLVTPNPRAISNGHFKFSKSADNLKLDLYAQSREGEMLIPTNEVDWKVVNGNGSIIDGVFYPSANTPSDFSIVQALKKNDPIGTIGAIAIIPVPFISVDDMLNN